MKNPFTAEFQALELTGISRIALNNMENPDIIPLWFGEGDIVTADFIRDAAKAALDEGQTFYANARGTLALRTAIKDYLDRVYQIDLHPDRISTPGSSMLAVTMAVQCTLGRGDHALVVSPFWPNIDRTIRITGAAIDFVRQEERQGRWHLDMAELFAKVTERTRLIYVNSPCNPTGWVMNAEDQQTLLAFCRARGIMILADEVYHRHVYDREVAPSFLTIAEDDDPVIVINGFSKAWAMTGWRLGWMVAPACGVEGFAVMSQCFNTGSTTFAQAGGIAALRERESVIQELRALYRRGRDMVTDILGNHPRIELRYPEGAFYAFPRVIGLQSSLAFAEDLVHKEQVGVAPGYTFGPGNEQHFRLSFACSQARLEEALGRIVRYLDQS